MLTNKLRGSLLTGAMILIAAPAFAAGYGYLHHPQPQLQGNVSYLTGGIGENETESIKSQAGGYNLLLSNADNSGHYMPGSDITITSHDGRQMMNVSDAGPLFYAKLPPGNYTLTATNGSQQEVRKIHVSANGSDRVHLIWH